MGTDFSKNREEGKEKDQMDSKKGRAAENPFSRERDREQAYSGEVSSAGSDKSFKPKNHPPAPSHEYYEVQNGDSLSGIAKDHYGDSAKWKIIYEANKNQIKDPDALQPGQMIELPDIRKEEM